MPLEILTMLGSGLLSGLLSIWSKSIEARKEQAELTLRMLASKSDAYAKARTDEVKTSGFSITRRIIAIGSVFAIIIMPLMVGAFYPDILVTYGYTEFNPGFLFFKGKEVIKWVTFEGGMVLTPLHTHVVTAILGLYFGHSIVKR